MIAFQLKSLNFYSNMAFKYTCDLSDVWVERYKNILLTSQEFISSWQIALYNKINLILHSQNTFYTFSCFQSTRTAVHFIKLND